MHIASIIYNHINYNFLIILNTLLKHELAILLLLPKLKNMIIYDPKKLWYADSSMHVSDHVKSLVTLIWFLLNYEYQFYRQEMQSE